MMARKTMAERYATQRSTKTGRRRALPRLSDATGTLDSDAARRDGSGELYDVHEAHLSRNAGAGATTFTAGSAALATESRPRGAMPRRVGGVSGGAGVATATSRVNYAYVRRDLRNIATIAVGMLVLLIVLNVILQAVIH